MATNSVELCRFIGLAGHKRRFIRKFSGISSAIHTATWSTRKFDLTEEMKVAFNTLKSRLISPPLLVFPDF